MQSLFVGKSGQFMFYNLFTFKKDSAREYNQREYQLDN